MMRNQIDHGRQTRRPLMEHLESRHLLAAAPTPLPDLKTELVYTPPLFVRPGGTVTAKLKVTNLGAPMPRKIRMPLNFYVSTTPTLPADTKPFRQTRSDNIQLARNASGTYSISAQVPSDITAGRFYLFVGLNENGKILKEKSLANNRTVSPPLLTPAGTYTGPFAGRDQQKGHLTLKLSPVPSGRGIRADVTLRTDLATIDVEGIRAKFRPGTGRFNIRARGTYAHPTLGALRYRIDMDGTLANKTYTGDARIVWHAATDSRNTWDKSVTLKRA